MKSTKVKNSLKRFKKHVPPFWGRIGAGLWKSIEIPLGALLERRRILKVRRIVWPVAEVADIERARMLGPTSGEVLVHVEFTMISPGTERAQIQGIVGNNFPYYPGYSGCGRVVSVGRNTEGCKKGDRVAGQIPHGSPATVDGECLLKIPDNVSFENAAFIQLGIIVLQGIHKAQIKPGESALILGQGLIGQIANRLSRLAGAAPIVAVARSKDKEYAAVNEWGADRFLTIDELTKEKPDEGFDIVIETSGDTRIIPIASRYVKRGGRVIGLGTPKGRGNIYLGKNDATSGVTIVGAHISGVPRYERSAGLWTYRSEGLLFLDLLAQRKLIIEDLISRRASPEDANSVYESLLRGGSGELGVIFDWRPDEGRGEKNGNKDRL